MPDPTNDKTKNGTSPKPKEIIKETEPLNIDSFASLSGLNWQTKSRLEHYVSLNNLSSERSVTEWQALLKKI